MAGKKKSALPVNKVEEAGVHAVMEGRDDRLADVLKGLTKKYGQGSIEIGTGQMHPLKRIPTGVFPLDLDLLGGIPQGRITVFKGKKSSCKTTLALKLASQVQRRCVSCCEALEDCGCGIGKPGRVVYFDVEGTVTTDWARAWGVDPSTVIWSKPELGDYMADMALDIVSNRVADLIIVDSVAAIQTVAESKKDSVVDDTMAVLAKMMAKFLRGLNRIMNEQERLYKWRPTVVLLNQLRDSFGMSFQGGGGPTAPGGHLIGFAASVELDLRATVQPGHKDSKGFGSYHYKVSKSKVSMPYLEGIFSLVFDEDDVGRPFGSCNDTENVFKAALGNEIVKEGLQHVLSWGDEREEIGTTQDAARSWITSHPEQIEEVKKAILYRVGNGD